MEDLSRVQVVWEYGRNTLITLDLSNREKVDDYES